MEAEQSVLGALMLDNRAWDKIADRVVTEDFYRPGHRAIFQTMGRLVGRSQPLDTLTVSEDLRVSGELEKVGGEAYVFELAQKTPSAANITAYADIVRERSILRQLIETATDITENAFDTQGRSPRDLLDVAEQSVFTIAEQHTRGVGPVEISKLLVQTTDKIDTLFHSKGAITGISTGFSDFDEMTSGLQAGDLVIIAGRPSMGKTTFAMNIAEYASLKQDKPALIFSMEMPGDSLTMRMMSSLGRIDQHRLRSGNLTDDDWPRITSAVGMLSQAKMYIDDTPALNPTEMRSRARRLARQYDGLSLIMIDYLQLMQTAGKSENRTNEISEISRSLKGLAKEMNCPVLALSQLNRSLEQRHDRRPVMSDLRESGAIEQDADLIAFIYRDEVYNEDTPDKGIAEVIIGKQRNGPIGKVRLKFHGKYTRFDNLVAEDAVSSGPFGG
ncbi:MAG: replicative DNA helicase [Coxiellaceae bacterium]|nr:replicative DNA helicase [Coxiellaceae bacterium]